MVTSGVLLLLLAVDGGAANVASDEVPADVSPAQYETAVFLSGDLAASIPIAAEKVLGGASWLWSKVKPGSRAAAAEAKAAEQALENTGAPSRGVGANRAAGNAARDLIAEREAPALIEQNLRTAGGLRRLDVLKEADELIGIESKVGRTGLTARVRQELARDVKLMRSGQLDKVRWEFWKSARTGQGGPSAPLRQMLEKFGVEIVEHDRPF